MVPAEADHGRLLAEYLAEVYAYAYRLCGSQAEAEELTQQVFLNACQKSGQLRRSDDPRPWLFTILRHCFWRHRSSRGPGLAADLELDFDSLPDGEPESDAIDGEVLQAALNKLPEAFRIVVLMFYFEGLTYREIAEKLDVPIGTVMSRLARAREYLKRLLAGELAVSAMKVAT